MVDTRKLDDLRASLLDTAMWLKAAMQEDMGTSFDPDSQSELSAVLRNCLGLEEYIGSRRITSSLLDDLAIGRPVLHPIVKYRRLRSQIQRIDSIAGSVREGRIYPIFNQIRSPSGRLSSAKPSLFDLEGINDLKECFSESIRTYFRDPRISLQILSDLSRDVNLQKDRQRRGTGSHRFMETRSIMKGLPHDDLLLSVVVGSSDAELSRSYLVDRLTMSTLHNDLYGRYPALFAWLETFREEAARRGFASIGDERKCLDGLQSSNVQKRRRAMNLTVRWAIQY